MARLTMTMPTTIDFSAQFGGRDAAQAVLPHFRALKAAAKGRFVTGFPLSEVAFILRVDGDVHAFGLAGAGFVEFDKGGGYVSVDIGITRDNWSLLDAGSLSALISGAVMASIELLEGTRDKRLAGADYRALETCLRELCVAYEALMAASLRG